MMKKSLAIIAFTFSVSFVVAAQSPAPQEGSKVAAPAGWCQGCTDSQKVQLISNEQSNKTGVSDSWPSTRPRGAATRPGSYALFTTKFLVNNDSNKKIKRVTWETTLFNEDTHEPIQTFSFTTKTTIAPHKSLVLKEKVQVPMNKLLGPVVPAGQPGGNSANPAVLEQYKIIEIEYKDGSTVRP
jgi:hypothetical protein